MVGVFVSFFLIMLAIALIVWLKSYYRNTLTKVANDPKLWQEWVTKSKATPEEQDKIQRKYGSGVIPLHSQSASKSEFTIEVKTSSPQAPTYGAELTDDWYDVPPMPWEQRQIYTSDDGRNFFIGWQGRGPETEFSLNRKSRVTIIPTKLMIGFDGKRYIYGLELPNEVEKIYCKDDISSQLKSKGYAADTFWPWAERALKCDTSILHSLTVGYDKTTFETLWEGEGPSTEFTYRHADDRERVKIIPGKIERHRIDGIYCITGAQEGKQKSYRYFEKKIETMLKSEGMKRLHLQDWVKSVCIPETENAS
ncbi:hypothetical protein [Oceanimonas smirnovii]|uniref:hypothetical protein n=1 Tax=Oceanimonas smirnovii TaxID=264574 RepID=UPI00035FB862|nr:hypothetical protein [Oceanimonas smirnovii]